MADLLHLLEELEGPENLGSVGDLNPDLNLNKANHHTGVDGIASYDELQSSVAAESPLEPREPASPDHARYAEIPAILRDAKRQDTTTLSPGAEADDADEIVGNQFEDLDSAQINGLCTKLHRYWSQEKLSPELLEYDGEMVREVREEISRRQEWIDELLTVASTAEREISVQRLLVTMAQIDLDRVKFVLTSWLAERLAKIEAHPLHMRENIDNMSDTELVYLQEYGAMLEDHLRRSVLDRIPEAWQALDEQHMIDKPKCSGYHFWIVNETIEVEGDHMEGSCLVAKYHDMKDNLRDGKVDLQL